LWKLAPDVHSISDPGPHLFWITSRAAGNFALIASSLSVGLGLVMVTREFSKRGRDLRIVHESLSLITLIALAVHGIALLGDSFMHPSPADVFVPLVWSYRSTWTTLGIIAGWTLVLLGPTFYLRNRIGPKRWRTLHRFSALAWLLGLVHAFGEGTDAGQTWFVAMAATVVVPAAVLLALRSMRRPQRTPPARRARAGTHTRPRPRSQTHPTGAFTDAT
jgi:sulfoxide reductase heme-binding subunit YedZ